MSFRLSEGESSRLTGRDTHPALEIGEARPTQTHLPIEVHKHVSMYHVSPRNVHCPSSKHVSTNPQIWLPITFPRGASAVALPTLPSTLSSMVPESLV